MKNRIAGVLALIVLIGGLAQAEPEKLDVFDNSGEIIVVEDSGEIIVVKDPPPIEPPAHCGPKGC
jgi:hypothetical protein